MTSLSRGRCYPSYGHTTNSEASYRSSERRTSNSRERDLAERCRRDFQSENSKLKKKVQFLEKIQRKEAERQVTEDMKKPPEQQSFTQRMKNLFFRKKANNLN